MAKLNGIYQADIGTGDMKFRGYMLSLDDYELTQIRYALQYKREAAGAGGAYDRAKGIAKLMKELELDHEA
jgi:hypothetical protein